jgi:hypothetical protein
MDSCLDQNTDPTSERQNLGSLFSGTVDVKRFKQEISTFFLFCVRVFRGRIQRKTWCMGSYARVDYNLTLCPLQSRLQHIYHGQPYATVDLNPMPESTLFPSQGLWIWPLDILDILIVFHKIFAIIISESRFPLCKKRP